ncbi:MAG: MFS transporter [Leptospiraceae bacterium]|jgi:MFS family permease|nr:MFS transporter [Leptospiraceae bacterium]MCZ8347818.1 MFS transporter [Leptospiraceae bacterium]
MTRNTLILFLIVFGDMMGFSVIFPLFPETIRHYIQLGNDPIFTGIYQLAEFLAEDKGNVFLIVLFGGILGSIYSILQFIFSPIWGRLSDNIGRKPILLFTSFGNLMGYVIWLFSASFTGFVLSRLITGAMGGNISVASASMADSTSIKDRAKGMGMIGAGIGLGFVFGPFLGGLLSGSELPQIFPSLSKISFTIFSTSACISLLIALFTLILVFGFYKETLPKLNGKLADSDQASEVNEKSIHPVFDMFSPRFRTLFSIAFIYLLFIFSFSGFEFCLNFFLNTEFAFTPKQIGLTFLYIGSIIILIQGGVVRRLSGKVAEVKIAIAGTVFLIFGYLGLDIFSLNTVLLFIFLGLLAVGSALLHPSLSSIASLRSSANHQGRSLGIFRAFGSLARAFAPISFALIYFQKGPYLVFAVCIGFSLLFGMLLLVIREHKREVL